MDSFYHTPTHPPIRKTQPSVLAGFGFHRTAEEETKAPPGAEFVHNEKKIKHYWRLIKGTLTVLEVILGVTFLQSFRVWSSIYHDV